MAEVGERRWCSAEMARATAAASSVTCWLPSGHEGPHDDLNGNVWAVVNEAGWAERLAEASHRAWETKGEPVTARDPRWNWVEVTTFGQDPAHPTYIKGTCRHVELEPVSGVGTVAEPVYRCETCGAYLRTVTSASLGIATNGD